MFWAIIIFNLIFLFIRLRNELARYVVSLSGENQSYQKPDELDRSNVTSSGDDRGSQDPDDYVRCTEVDTYNETLSGDRGYQQPDDNVVRYRVIHFFYLEITI